MANLKVRLVIKVKLEDGQRVYRPIVRAKNKAIKLQWALMDGKEELHPEGVYTLVFRENGKQRTQSVESAQDVLAGAVRRKQQELQAIANGHKTSKVGAVEDQRLLKASATSYLSNVETMKGPKTHSAYSGAVIGFTNSCTSVTNLEDLKDAKVAEGAIINYWKTLRERGDSDRYISNKVTFVRTFFLKNGIPWPLKGNDMPSYTEKIVKMYSKDQLVKLLAASSREEYERHQFFLGTGMRDEEVQFAFYKDIDFDSFKFNVKAKPELRFKIKGRQERSIPIPESLVNLLKERWKRSGDSSRFIFPAPNGGPNVHLLRALKLLAFRNGMNCGDCISKKGLSCADEPVCEHWILHRFRKTFATLHYRSGKVTMKTIQTWLGHEKIETTMLYLADELDESLEIRSSVNNVFAFANGAPQLLNA